MYFQINVFETYQIFVIVHHYITETCKEAKTKEAEKCIKTKFVPLPKLLTMTADHMKAISCIALANYLQHRWKKNKRVLFSNISHCSLNAWSNTENLLANINLTCDRDDKGSIHGINVQGSGSGRQVEIGNKVGKLTEDQRPSVYAKERVLQQREIQYFGFCDSHLTWRACMWGKSNNRGPIHTAIELRWAIWSCGFTLTQVMMGLMAIYSIQDQSGQFRVHWLVLESLSTLPPHVHGVPMRGRRGLKTVWFGDAIGNMSGPIQTVLGVLLLWGALERNSRTLLDGRGGRVWNRWLYIDGSQQHARGHQIQHETTENQHGS